MKNQSLSGPPLGACFPWIDLRSSLFCFAPLVAGAGNCTPGFVCINATRQQCPAASYCPAGTTAPIPCSLGAYCAAGTTSLQPCAAGNFCPSVVQQLACNQSNYCPANSTAPSDCEPGYFCATPATKQLCLAGYFCEANAPQTGTLGASRVRVERLFFMRMSDSLARRASVYFCFDCISLFLAAHQLSSRPSSRDRPTPRDSHSTRAAHICTTCSRAA